MITFVNKNNADKYSFLYSQASHDLRTHDANGDEVPMGHIDALLGFEELSGDKIVTVDEFEPGRYYVKNGSDYTLCMLTKEEYAALEKKPVLYLSDDLTSLDEYFSYIVQLNKISKRYTILPLDEEVFEIDADTRTITVPNSFKTNGISVQGDEVAEIVYFRINRFFDAMDLALRDIYIEWKSAAKDENGKEITGVSVPWVIDYESEPNHIIFGWALSSKITQAAGTVTFAVRFYTFDKEEQILEYSLSTLQQTATIKPSLNFDLRDIIMDGSLIDDCDALITDRFKNSKLSSAAVQAEIPEWIKDLKLADDTLVDTEKKIVYVNLADVKDGKLTFKTGAITRDVQAIAPDAGSLSYTWKKYDYDTNRKLDLDFDSEFVPTTDTVKVTGKLYYVPNANAVGGYALYNEEILDPTNEKYPESGVFERVSRGVINSIGKYIVVCTNRVKNSTATNETWTLVVPRPVEPDIDTNVAERGALLEAANYKAVLSVGASVTDEGTLTYQWYKKAPNQDEFVAIAGATESSYQIKGGAPTEDDSATGAPGDGYYMVEVTNNLNTEVTGERAIDTIQSATCRITHTAEPLEIKVVGDVNYTLSDLAKGKKCEIAVSHRKGSGEPIQRTEEDKILYQWYKYGLGVGANVEDDIEKAELGEYVINNDRAIEGANEANYVPQSVGWYFCEVTNKYNNTEARKLSKFFSIGDA